MKQNEINSKQRSEIIHDNFLHYKGKISDQQYAKDNNVDKTTISKWRNNKNNMTVDHIYDAAKYFNITVNDLYYTTEEKKKIAVFANSSYNPIVAQHTVNVKLIRNSFKRPLFFIFSAIVAFAIFTSLSFLFMNLSVYWSFLIMFGLFICHANYRKYFAINKTYIINYLDDIYYKRESTKNKYAILSIVLIILSIIILIVSFGSLPLLNYDEGSDEVILMIIYAIIMLVCFILTFFMLLSFPYRFNKEIYDDEIEGYNVSVYLLFISFLQFSFTLLMYSKIGNQVLTNSICSFLILSINIIIFLLISKEYSDYKLVYKEDCKEPRELFPQK